MIITLIMFNNHTSVLYVHIGDAHVVLVTVKHDLVTFTIKKVT